MAVDHVNFVPNSCLCKLSSVLTIVLYGSLYDYIITYRRIGLSGAHRYLEHTANQAHAVFLIKSVQTLIKKSTTLIEQNLGVGKVKLQVDKLEQARNGSAKEDHVYK